jgi:hypothetical protein
MGGKAPVIRKPVCLIYKGEEMVKLVKAAHQLPLYHLDVSPSQLRIDCHSLASGSWRCTFVFSRDANKSWVLNLIEYDLSMTLKRALTSLGQLEEMGLKHLKYGI